MARADSNLPEIEAALDAVAEAFNFEAPGIEGKGLGHEMLNVVADGILDRTIAEQKEPTGSALNPLSPAYKAWKAGHGYPTLIGVKTGHMLSLVEVQGERVIAPDEATMTYGKPGSTDDEGKTSRDKAEWFTDGDPARNRPARPFYDLDEEIETAASDHAEKALDEFLDKLGF